MKKILILASIILVSCAAEIEENQGVSEYQEPYDGLSSVEKLLVGEWHDEEKNLSLSAEKINKTWAFEGKELFLRDGNKIDRYEIIRVDSVRMILGHKNEKIELTKSH